MMYPFKLLFPMFSPYFLGVFLLLLMVNGENSRRLIIGVISFVYSIVVQAGFLNTKSALNALETVAEKRTGS
jgi:hypothetical protein